MSADFVMKRFKELAERQHPGGAMLRLFGKDLGARHVIMSMSVVKPGERIGMHRHEKAEEIYVLASGASQITIDDTTLDVEAVTVFRFPAATMRGILNNSQDDALWFFVGAPINEYTF